MSIEQQIKAALAGRAAQREFVDNLYGSWEHLTATWTSLMTSAGDLAVAAVAARSPDHAEAGVFADLARYLDKDANWWKRCSSVSGQIRESTGLVRTLQRRVHRETVNIGVIGQTGAGKSTLLRKLSGLGQEHIPSNRFSSTTATPSRIFHEPGSGPGRAVLTLHTWQTFRADVLVPLHEDAKIPGDAPLSVEEFRRFSGYRDEGGEVPAGQAGAERFRRRLRQAQDSLPSYQDLLLGGTQQITLDRLRPFVAYPADDDIRSDYLPYHAVRSVDIFCEFPELGAIALGLVDLPGAGEAGLDVHGRFLNDLRNHADLLFIVKRPEKAPVTDPDWDARQLADDAAAGVRRSDFAHQVINRDAGVPDDFFANALTRAKRESERLGIDVLECDIESSAPAQVVQVILSPVLAKLAERLAYMDRDAAEEMLSDLARIAGQMQSLADDLARWIERRQGDLPDEEKRLRARARDLKNDISAELGRVRDKYDKLYASGAPITELHQEIEKAGREMREWLTGGLGAGSTQEWLRKFNNAVEASDMGRELDHRYNSARKQVVEVFGGIDASLGRSVDRLWGEVADALRVRLTDALVPLGPDHRAILSAFADTAQSGRARTLNEATDRLLNLPTDYGSIFLRVGRPIIRKIEWDHEEHKSQLGQKVAAAAIGGVAGAGVSAAAGPVIGMGAAHLAASAVSKAAAAGAEEGMRRASTGKREWWHNPPGGAQEASPEPTAPPAGSGERSTETDPNAVASGSGASGSASVGGEFAKASRWHDKLTDTIEQVTRELEREFHDEAQRTLQVLAAAVDLFKDTATSTPDVESEYEKLCRPAQRQIWPEDFGGAAAEVAADLAALRQRAMEADTAAGQVASLAVKARRL